MTNNVELISREKVLDKLELARRKELLEYDIDSDIGFGIRIAMDVIRRERAIVPGSYYSDADGLTLGERIHAVLKSKKMKQYKLAELVNVTQGTISRTVNGMTVPRFETICDIADALGVSSKYLMTGEE